MHEERISLTDTAADVTWKLSEGVPGAIAVIGEILARGATIDPDDFLGGIGTLLHLDSFGIYGHRIWMLYKDVCKEDLVDTIGVVRACQLGFVNRDAINRAIDSHGSGLDVVAAMRKVRERLPRFGLMKADTDTHVESLSP